MLIQYKLDEKQYKELEQWLDKQNKDIIEKQRSSMSAEDFEDFTMNGQFAYTGAIGGGVTYMLTDTSLGTIIKVKHAITNEELDLTNYDEW